MQVDGALKLLLRASVDVNLMAVDPDIGSLSNSMRVIHETAHVFQVDFPCPQNTVRKVQTRG